MSFKIETPKGKTSNKWFAMGYQSAMQDIARELANGGAQAVAEWLSNNNLNATPAESLALVAGSIDTITEVVSEYAPAAVEWNGRKYGELSREERDRVNSEVAQQMARELSSPAMAAALGADIPSAPAVPVEPSNATPIEPKTLVTLRFHSSRSVFEVTEIREDMARVWRIDEPNPDREIKGEWVSTQMLVPVDFDAAVNFGDREGRSVDRMFTDSIGLCAGCEKNVVRALVWNGRRMPAMYGGAKEVYEAWLHVDGSAPCKPEGLFMGVRASCGACGAIQALGTELFTTRQEAYGDRVTCTACGNERWFSIGD